MEVALEAVVIQLDVQLLYDILHDKELAVLDRLFERLLNVPEHQVLELVFLCEQFLEAIQVSFNRAVHERPALCHEFHKQLSVLTLQGLYFLPKTNELKLEPFTYIIEFVSILLKYLCAFSFSKLWLAAFLWPKRAPPRLWSPFPTLTSAVEILSANWRSICLAMIKCC